MEGQGRCPVPVALTLGPEGQVGTLAGVGEGEDDLPQGSASYRMGHHKWRGDVLREVRKT